MNCLYVENNQAKKLSGYNVVQIVLNLFT